MNNKQKLELIWEGKYDERGKRVAPLRVALPFQTVETINEATQQRRKNLLLSLIRENVRAQLRVIVKRIPRKYGYPPDKQEKTTQTVVEQAKVLSVAWATA